MTNNYICIYCNSSYLHKTNLDLHYTYCKKKSNKSLLKKFCNIFNYNNIL